MTEKPPTNFKPLIGLLSDLTDEQQKEWEKARAILWGYGYEVEVCPTCGQKGEIEKQVKDWHYGYRYKTIPCPDCGGNNES